MGKKRTKIIGAEEFEGLAPEDLLKRPKKVAEKEVTKKSAREHIRTPGLVKDDKAKIETKTEIEKDTEVLPEITSEVIPVEATKKEVREVVAKRKRIERRRGRGAAYKLALSQIDRKKVYKLEKAIELLKKIAYAKFDQTVDLHVHTLSKKGQEPIRFILVLPAGAVKQPRVRVIDEVALQAIEAGKIDFDIALAAPSIMPKLAKFAKVLGPRGLMPNPKAGTVTDDPQKALEQFQKGQIEVRSDSLGNIHVGLAKLSWEAPRIVENVKAVVSRVPTNRIGSVTLTATMAPGLKIAL